MSKEVFREEDFDLGLSAATNMDAAQQANKKLKELLEAEYLLSFATARAFNQQGLDKTQCEHLVEMNFKVSGRDVEGFCAKCKAKLVAKWEVASE